MMRFTVLLILTFLLSGCAKTPVSETIAENAINQATAVEQSLPKQCATESIKTQINALKTQINAIVKACDTEKQTIEQEKVRWKWSFLGLLLVVLAYILRKVSK